LMREISEALVDLGMPPIPGILQNPPWAGDVFEAATNVLECLWEGYAFGHGTWDKVLHISYHRFLQPFSACFWLDM
jgi:hypothetical protein